MAVLNDWFNDAQTIYCIKFGGKWSWQDFSQTVDSAYAEINDVSHPVDLIIWFETELPRGNAIPHLQRAGDTQPDNICYTVFINNGTRFVEAIVGSVVKYQDWVQSKFVKNLSEALTHLDEMNRNTSVS